MKRFISTLLALAFTFICSAQKTSKRTLGGSLLGDTKISTPSGDKAIKNLKVGDEVWSTDFHGKKIKVKVKKVGKGHAQNFNVFDITLKDKRSLVASHKHPDAEYKALLFYKVGDTLDGSKIVKMERQRMEGDSVWDILPDKLMATYWANGILLTSSMLETELNEIRRGSKPISRVYVPWGDNALIQKYEKEYGCIYNPEKDAKIKGKNKEEIDALILKGVSVPYEERINARVRSVELIMVIDKSGKISRVDVNKGINDKVNNACIASVKALPQYTPASNGNESVNTVKKAYIEFDMYGNVKRTSHGRLIFNEEYAPSQQPKIKVKSSPKEPKH